MNDEKNFYTIGEISTMLNFSRRQLMYFEDKGIIVPEMRGENNYRYYSQHQLEELLLIKELRRVDFSLDNLATILAKRDLSSLRIELERKMNLHSEKMIQCMQEYNHYHEIYARVLKSLVMLEKNSSEYQEVAPSTAKVKFAVLPDMNIVYLTYYGQFNNRYIFMEKLAEVYDRIDKYKLLTNGPLYVIFHKQYYTSFLNIEGSVELFVPLKKKVDSCPYVREFKAARFIYTTLLGDYSNLHEAYATLEEWAKIHEFPLSGTSIEEYLVNPTMTNDPNQYITNIYLKLA